jgi:hypothetical protein
VTRRPAVRSPAWFFHAIWLARTLVISTFFERPSIGWAFRLK